MDEVSSSNLQLTHGLKPSRTPVVISAVTAALGAFAMGCTLGYSSPASAQLATPTNVSSNFSECGGQLSYSLNTGQISWFGSTLNIGAFIGAPLGGFCINLIGRRTTMIASLSVFLLAWLLIGLADNFAMLIAGRIFSGVAAGLVCLSVPNYIGEISSPDIRGLLGTVFQLNTVTGILYVYAVGAGLCWQWLALACLLPAIIFSVGMIFHKESPTFLVAKEKEAKARDALTYLRGPNYNIETELNLLRHAAEEDRNKKATLNDLLVPHVLRPFLISLGLMFFQQFCGINAILFNLTTIFTSAGSDLSPSASSIIVGAVQVVATGAAAVLMDKAGRKMLLIISAAVMGVSLVVMGVYFYLKDHDKGENLSWLPLLCLVVFIAFFAIGYGPIPWLMMGELFPSDVRALAGSIATLTNWAMSFIVTLTFAPLQDAIHDYGAYWLFAGLCGVNLVFTILFVKETKGKSLEEISIMFGKPVSPEEGKSSRKSSMSYKDSRDPDHIRV